MVLKKQDNNLDDSIKITPNIGQMRFLQSLGLDCDDASMTFHPAFSRSETFIRQIGSINEHKAFCRSKARIAIMGEDYYERVYGRDVPAFTVDDMMAKIPFQIDVNGIRHQLFITKRKFGDEWQYEAGYCFPDENGKMCSSVKKLWKSDSLVLLLYGILIWCINNNHIEVSNGCS